MQYLFFVQLIIMIFKPLLNFILRLLGVGFVSYYGINAIMDEVKDYVVAQFGAASLPVQQILGLAKVDIAINIIFAAIVTRMVLGGVDRAADKLRTQVWTEPGKGGGTTTISA